MKVSILIVGDEILKNRVTESNSKIISDFFIKKGYDVIGKFIVGDDYKNIDKILKFSLKNSNFIVITGGLGPTPDDITLDAVARSLKREVIFSEEIFRKVSQKMKNVSEDIVKKQSRIIEGSKVFENEAGIAFCHFLKSGKVKIFLLPGVVREVEWIVVNILEKLIPDQQKKEEEYNLKIFNTTESYIYQVLKEKFNSKRLSNVHFYPSFGFIDLFFPDKEILKFLKIKFSNNFLETGTKNLVLYLKEEFERKNLTLSVAESCTGGFLAKRLTDIEGSSSFFLGGVVVYSNDSKNVLLRVDEKILKKYGAVSKEVSFVMAKNCAKIFNSDLSVSITGIAGPSGGSVEKPVGTVFISTFYRDIVKTEKYIFTGSRDIVRQKSVNLSMFSILRRIKDE
ncbi:MAG: nicotinamide-nucleotide amidohydrolase family protein [candidate division WOR-3 bacterium]|jgi:nicotinamide-nucleotide amidase